MSAADKGRSTIITKHGRPVAVLVPVENYVATGSQDTLVPLAGSERGMWGADSGRTIRDLRDEWVR